MTQIPEQAFTELRQLYSRLAADLEPHRRHCEARGNCCNFAATEHMLFVTDLEAAEMARSGEAPNRAQAESGSCPYLRGKTCGVREHRALGCRIYYCDRTYEEQRNALYERYLSEIRAIEKRHGIEHYYRAVTEVNFEEAARR